MSDKRRGECAPLNPPGMYGQPTEVTNGQFELLMKIWPGPIGEGMTMVQAAKELGISRNSAYKRLNAFKENYPEKYEQYEDAVRLMRKDRMKLQSPRSVDKFLDTEDYISEVF